MTQKKYEKSIQTSGFFRTPDSIRSINTGINTFALSEQKDSPINVAQLEEIKKTAIPYPDNRKFFIPYTLSIHEYSMEIINDCLKNLYNGKTGYVFTKTQLIEVLRIIGTELQIKNEDNIWFLYKETKDAKTSTI